MGDGVIRNDFTAKMVVSNRDIGTSDTQRNSAARQIISDDHITEAELTQAGVTIPDMTHISSNAATARTEIAGMKSNLTQQLEGIGFDHTAAETLANRIVGLRSRPSFIQSSTSTVQDAPERVQTGTRTVGYQFTGQIDRSTWQASIHQANPPNWNPSYFMRNAGEIQTNTAANFANMINTFGPSNPTGQEDFRTAIHNGFPQSTITDAECDQLLSLMQNAHSTGDVRQLQTLLAKVDPEFSTVLNQNGGIDGKLGFKTPQASRMLDAAVEQVRRPITEPVFEERPRSHPVTTTSQGSFDIKLTDPPSSSHTFTWPHLGGGHGNGLHGRIRDRGRTDCPHF